MTRIHNSSFYTSFLASLIWFQERCIRPWTLNRTPYSLWGICTADPCFRNPPLYSHTLSGSTPDIREMNKLMQIEYLTFDSKQKFKRSKNQLIMHNSFQILVQILYQTELIGCAELSLVTRLLHR